MEENEKSFTKFLIVWIIIVVIIVGVPIFNIILVSKGWHLKIFGSDTTKEIDGKIYVGISEYLWDDGRKVIYYPEYNKYVFRKDEKTYIVEYFDLNDNIPNSRYYYENGQCVKEINFDEKGNIIEEK